MNILVIRLSSMGDVVLISPLLTYIKSKVYEAKITVLTNELYTDLFKSDPRVTSVVSYHRHQHHSVLSRLASSPWNLILDLQGSRRSWWIQKKYFSTFPCKTFKKMQIKRLALLFFRVNLYSCAEHVAYRYIETSRLASRMDSDIPSVKLYFDRNNLSTDSYAARQLEKLDGKLVIALFPFSAWKNKQWPLCHYAAVGKHFQHNGWGIIILGGPDDKTSAERLQNDIGGNCISFAGKADLYEAGVLLSHSILALGNDTGLSHLARACSVPTGIIYGATTWHFGFFPYGEPPFKIFQTRHHCRPCHPHGGDICWRMDRRCLKMISPDEVIKGLEQLFYRNT